MGLYDKRIEQLKTVEEAIAFQRELKHFKVRWSAVFIRQFFKIQLIRLTLR